MSDVSQGPGWWIASDGKWYPPHLHPDYPAQSQAEAQAARAHITAKSATRKSLFRGQHLGQGPAPTRSSKVPQLRRQLTARQAILSATGGVAVLVLILVLQGGGGSSPSASTTTTTSHTETPSFRHGSQVAAFRGYVRQINHDLLRCSVPTAEFVDDETHTLHVTPPPSTSILNKVATVATTARLWCTQKSDPTLNRLDSIQLPKVLSSFHGLTMIPDEVQAWANTDETSIFRLNAEILTSETLTQTERNGLSTEVEIFSTKANELARTITAVMAKATSRLGLPKNDGQIDLVIWATTAYGKS